jgi:peptidoglycan biosynthesis protein MviN/MurJ (putative lipid II flippase)
VFDPVTISAAVATASTAFNGIKRAFQAGRDLESMTQDLSRWMGAVSDVDAAHNSAKNPTMFRKVFSGGSIEQEAIEAFTAKKRLEEQRYELQQFIKFTHGTAAWDELLRMEGQIRKRRQKEIYDRKIFREKVIGIIVLIIVLVIGLAVLGLFVYSLMGIDRGWFEAKADAFMLSSLTK